MFFAIEGCIAAGKTTTAQHVSEALALPPLMEETEAHPFLADFYQAPERFALETEMGFVLLHYHQIHRLPSSDNFVTDFSPVKDLVFGKMNLKGDDLDLFEHVYSSIASRIPKPDLAIYLDVPLEELLQRIKTRGRPYELAIPRSYLENLSCCYQDHLDQLGRRVHVLEVAAGASPDEVAEKAIEIVRRELQQSEAESL